MIYSKLITDKMFEAFDYFSFDHFGLLLKKHLKCIDILLYLYEPHASKLK